MSRSVELATFTHDMRIARVQRTLRWLEQDVPLLAMRVKDLSPERQRLAKRFAANMIDHTRAELERLMEERANEAEDPEFPCEPAD
jgi:CRP-like cAMP-binding protein